MDANDEGIKITEQFKSKFYSVLSNIQFKQYYKS
jgi:hypothetical protein